MLGTILNHPDLAVPFDDVGFHLANLLVQQLGPFRVTARDRLAGLFHALRAKRVGLSRPAEDGLGLLPGLQQRFFSPLGSKSRVWIELVKVLDRIESHTGAI